ncbi:hypothetical protein FACS1894179_01010 [Bacteroidia bacterium]|nr:hypothetical protein FACS1894169_08100 [Bacteroidia bacterium]GHV38141.1 hypothetical protein FACS1894179_01010 [Bacteroidia bacterium]
MKKLIILIYILLLSLIPIYAQQTWNFDNNKPLNSDSNTPLILHSIRDFPELVEGIEGKGLRTDGYTTWLTANFIPAQEIKSISAWFALESFPTDTAAFYGIRSLDKEEAFSLCVDKYGSVMLSIYQNGEYVYLPTTSKVRRFEWINLLLSINKKNIDVFINGDKNFHIPYQLKSTSFNEVILAKDFKDKKLGIYDLTVINAIVDDIKIWTEAIDDYQSIKNKSSVLAGRKPVLAIPHSRFEKDFSRPKYHLLPAANWTNETHGLFFHKSRYHIFNQKNASNLFLGQINWGHFSSPDLINWTEHKPAITPEPGYDCNGIWSGHAVIDDNQTPVLVYTTGGEKMGVGLAYPKDENLIEWSKYENNPVVWGQPKGYARTDLRDQYVWKEKDIWYMIIGFGIVDDSIEKGAVLLYKSKNLKDWEFIHTLFEGDPKTDDSGIFWEMPVFWKHENKYILLVNKVPHQGVPAKAMYWTGEFKNEKFIPDHKIPHNLEVINRLLSPSVSYDENGLVTAIAIIPDEIGSWAAYQHGWTHLYSIPRVWNFNNGIIEQTPHPSLKQLRGERIEVSPKSISEEKPLKLTDNDNQLEVRLIVNPNGSKKFGFYIHKNTDNSEFTKIYYDAVSQEIVVDQRYSSLKKYVPLNIRKGKYKLDLSEPVDFHIFIDGSVIEVFINNKDAFTTRIFPLKENSSQFELFTEDTDIKVKGELWYLKQANMNIDF